jgi:hypothetical protein
MQDDTESKAAEKVRATHALGFIIPILTKHGFKWVITGGFACYVYGVDRLLTDIDIDIDTSMDSDEFRAFLWELNPYITQPLENFVDGNYDNYNFEITFQGQVIDICPMADIQIFNPASNDYESFYRGRFPEIETVHYAGFDLPLLVKEAIIANKKMLAHPDEWDQRDIDGLRALIVDKKA